MALHFSFVLLFFIFFPSFVFSIDFNRFNICFLYSNDDVHAEIHFKLRSESFFLCLELGLRKSDQTCLFSFEINGRMNQLTQIKQNNTRMVFCETELFQRIPTVQRP